VSVTIQPRRTRKNPADRRAASRTAIALPPAISQSIAEQDRAMRQQEFKALGKLLTIITPVGAIEMGHDGPLLGVSFARQELLLLSPWTGIPDRRENSEEFCTACLVTCVDCAGKGRRSCNAVRPIGKPDHQGQNPVAEGEKDPVCDVCQGTLVTDCLICHGKGQRSSGIQNGKTCSVCSGSGRAGTVTRQEQAQFSQGKFGEYEALGPVIRIVFYTLGEGSGLVVVDFRPDAGKRLASLLLSGTKAYFYGGVPVLPPELLPSMQ